MLNLIKDAPHLSRRYFKSYEEREEDFRERVFSLIPRKYSGPKLFWRDFGSLSLQELMEFARQPIAYITGNPRDGLAFGTAWQVLRAADMCARKAGKESAPTVAEVAGDYDIGEHLHQPIRTLSGGETVKLALAKAAICARYSGTLIIASPFSWLSRENAHLFRMLFDHYAALDIPVELFALEGEDCDEPVEKDFLGCVLTAAGVGFGLQLKDVRIPLGSSLNPLHSRPTYARVADTEAALDSPCLIVGGNGQGKSLIAKMLAGAISYRGKAALTRAGASGSARLLFQDVMIQTLLRSFEAIAESSNLANGLKPMELWEKILTEFRIQPTGLGQTGDDRSRVADSGFRSLLEVKTILIAVRLCGRPSALILDEPDWGLSRPSAIALVAAVIKVAHGLGIPVVLISHKPWWHPIAKSVIRVEKTQNRLDVKGTSAFEIRLSCESTA